MTDLLALPDDLLAEDDCDLAIGRLAFDGGEARLFGGVRALTFDVRLELAHEKKEPNDREGPRDQYAEEKPLIWTHHEKCRKP